MKQLPAIIVAIMLVLWSCSNDETAPRQAIDGNKSPTMITDSVNSFISDSGITRYQLQAPEWLMYDDADEPYWLFPKGLQLNQFDDNMQVVATMVADTARYYSRMKLWKLDSNVRMRRINGEKFRTQQLFWNQQAHKVYSDSFIHIERPERILEGYGFVSNEQMTDYTIRRPTGIFPTAGFTGGGQQHNENTPPPSATSSTNQQQPIRFQQQP